jgi:type IV pilus assembly protein PilO
MKFDVNKLKDINDLDFEQVAIWPFEVKSLVAMLVIIISLVLGYYFLVKDKLPILEVAQNKEIKLKQIYQGKYRIAVNLQAYEEQLGRLKSDFSSMLKSLPTSNETPGLLDDITLVGTSAGLPIEMEVFGGYHNFGQFASEIAGLPRIVTVHDFEVTQEGNALKLTVQAKTYRTSSEQDTATVGETQ